MHCTTNWNWSFLLLLLTLAISVFCFLACSTQIGWISDDYGTVIGADPFAEIPSFLTVLKRGGEGHITAVRLLSQPINAYGKVLFGTCGAHIVQVFLHFICGLMIFLILCNLQWDRYISLWAATAFIVGPLGSQPIFWWQTVCAPIVTLLVLIAGYAHICGLNHPSKKLLYLLISAICLFISMLLYEIWLAGFVFLWAIDYYFKRIKLLTNKQFENRSKTLIISLRSCIFLMLPYIIWAIWFKISYHAPTYQPVINLRRMVITLASTHLRIFDLRNFMDWENEFRSGISFITNLKVLILIVIFLLAVTLLIIRLLKYDKILNIKQERNFSLIDALMLAWGCFLGSRLVYVLGGAVDINTRHSYGASAAIGIAMAALLYYALTKFEHKVRIKTAIIIFANMFLILGAIVTCGIGVHFAETSRLEELTYKQFRPIALKNNHPKTFVVIGNPNKTRGEFNYFCEDDGSWLKWRLKKCNPEISAYVFYSAQVDFDGIRVKASERSPGTKKKGDLFLPWKDISVYSWKDGKLIPLEKPI